jgi:hypothetical protein
MAPLCGFLSPATSNTETTFPPTHGPYLAFVDICSSQIDKSQPPDRRASAMIHPTPRGAPLVPPVEHLRPARIAIRLAKRFQPRRTKPAAPLPRVWEATCDRQSTAARRRCPQSSTPSLERSVRFARRRRR